jgi:hypothetical protein
MGLLLLEASSREYSCVKTIDIAANLLRACPVIKTTKVKMHGGL